MTGPSHSSAFEKAIAVTPIDASNYSAFLDPLWCIGKVPHGGYTASVLYRTAATHFAQKAADPNARRGRGRAPEPIGLQINFQRRTFAGPAFLTVQEIKLGARISTIHVTLSQVRDEVAATTATTTKVPDRSELEVKVLAYITLSPPDVEEGPIFKGPWGNLSPAPPAGSLPGGSVDFKALAESGIDGGWGPGPKPHPTIHAAKHVKLYIPSSTMSARAVEERTRHVVDQWAQFAPGGTPARWTNEAVVYLADFFPAALDRLGALETTRILAAKASAGPAEEGGAAIGKDGVAQFWYPTVTMNVDLKTRIPPEGVEWLHSRVVTRMLRGSRADLDVLILDREGELVATSSQVALVVDPARNSKGRQNSAKL